MAIGIGNKQVFARHGNIYIRVNPYNLQLVDVPVKDHKGENVDNNSQDVQNNYKENQDKDTDMTIEVDTEQKTFQMNLKKKRIKKINICRLMNS